LLYRIVFKLPFVKIETQEGQDLKSLFVNNDAKLAETTMLTHSDKIFELINDLSADDIKNKSSKDLYELLKSTLGEF